MATDPEFDDEPEETRFVAVFGTGKIIQFDMAVDVLKQAHIPFQTQEVTATGMRLSMPLAPTPGPGVATAREYTAQKVTSPYHDTRRILPLLSTVTAKHI